MTRSSRRSDGAAARAWRPEEIRGARGVAGQKMARPTLGFDPNDADPPFLKPAVSELAKSDRTT